MLFYWVGERGSGISHRLKATLLIHRRKNLLIGVFLDLPIADFVLLFFELILLFNFCKPFF